MSVRTKILIVVLCAATFPVVISAWTTIAVHEEAFENQLAENRRQAASAMAAGANTWIANSIESLRRAARSTPWKRLDPTERNGALWFLYRQVDSVGAVAMMDEGGTGIDSVYRSAAQGDAHPPMTLEGLAAFGRAVPLETLSVHETSIGKPFADEGRTFLPVAIRVVGEGERYVLAVAVQLEPMCEALRRDVEFSGQAHLVDSSKRVVCSTAEMKAPLQRATGSILPAISKTTAEREFRTTGADPQFLTVTKSDEGWRVVAQQSVADALGPSVDLRNRALFWVVFALLGSVFASLLIANTLSRPVQELVKGADAVAGGQFHHRLEVQGRDEFAQLAGAFNTMCDEIQVWNRELNHRVAERTRQLTQAQNQLIEARKMSAMAVLGAGIAHEINNPLTAVIAMSQVARQFAKKGLSGDRLDSPLSRVEEQAARIAKIVKKMLLLSQAEGKGLAEHEVGEVLEAAAASQREKLEDRGISFTLRVEDGLPQIQCDLNELTGAIASMLDNSMRAIGESAGEIELAAGTIDGGLVKIEVHDTGRGIAPKHIDKVFEPFFSTKEEGWEGEGLGLAVAHRVLSAHHATVSVQSELGEGTTMTILIPSARQGAHLS